VPEENLKTTEKNSKQSFVDNLNSHDGILRNIIIVNFFYQIFSAAFTFMLPLYAINEGWLTEYYGLILAIGGYVGMGVSFLLGIIVDLQFKRTTLLIGIITSIVSAILFTRIKIEVFSIIFYCFFAIGKELKFLSINTFIANETKKGQDRTKGFSGKMISDGLSQIIAPIFCGYLLIVLDFNWVFTIITIFGIIAFILIISLRFAVEETPKKEIDYAENLSEKSGDDYVSFLDKKKGKRAVISVQISFTIGKMLMGFTSGIAIPFINWYIINQFNLTSELWGWISTIAFAVLTLGYLLMGLFAEKIGKEIIIVIFWILVIPSAIGIMFAQSLFLVSLFYSLRLFFAMSPRAIWNSFMYEWIPPKNRGKLTGFVQTATRGMRSTGMLIGGYLFSILSVAIFPIAMTVYPISGLLPIIQSKIVKRRLITKSLEEEEKTKTVCNKEIKTTVTKNVI
jgi:MFS family permease